MTDRKADEEYVCTTCEAVLAPDELGDHYGKCAAIAQFTRRDLYEMQHGALEESTDA